MTELQLASPDVATVSPFEALGNNLRFGTTEDGTPFVIAADFARAMGHRDARDAARLLDEDEKGTQIVRTPGGDQRMTVFYEDGIWELIFRSTKPEAKALKKRVKEILAEIRRTGTYSAATMSDEDKLVALAEGVLAARKENAALKTRVAELEPAAAAATALTDASGTLTIGAVANMFGVGRTRFFRILYAENILMRDRRPYQQWADAFRVVASTHETSNGKTVVDYTSYLYPAGAVRLHRVLTRRGYTLNPPDPAAVDRADLKAVNG